jgi:hypothetical protein
MWGRDVDEFVKSAVNSFGNNMFIMGLYYRKPNRAWPRWLREQLSPGGRGFEPAQLMPFRNLHFKNWGIVGSVYGINEAIVDPSMLFVTRRNVAFEVWIHDGSRLYTPGSHGSFSNTSKDLVTPSSSMSGTWAVLRLLPDPRLQVGLVSTRWWWTWSWRAYLATTLFTLRQGRIMWITSLRLVT